MLRTDDGSIRGTIKMIESLKLRNAENEGPKLRRQGEGTGEAYGFY